MGYIILFIVLIIIVFIVIYSKRGANYGLIAKRIVVCYDVLKNYIFQPNALTRKRLMEYTLLFAYGHYVSKGQISKATIATVADQADGFSENEETALTELCMNMMIEIFLVDTRVSHGQICNICYSKGKLIRQIIREELGKAGRSGEIIEKAKYFTAMNTAMQRNEINQDFERLNNRY